MISIRELATPIMIETAWKIRVQVYPDLAVLVFGEDPDSKVAKALAFEMDCNLEQMISTIDDPQAAVFGAFDNDTLIGTASCTILADKLYVHGNYILKQYQGQGVGRQLMQTRLRWGYERGLRVASGEVADGNPRALAFIQGLGFQHHDTRKSTCDPTVDVLILERAITDVDSNA